LGAAIAWLLMSFRPRDDEWPRLVFIGLATVATAAILALSSPFVLWHASGMENPYKSVALVGLLATLDQMLRRGRIWPAAVAVAVLAAITRIDAVIPVAMLLVCFAALWRLRHRNFDAARFACACLLPWLAFMIWRRWYFGVWAPNTGPAQGILLSA